MADEKIIRQIKATNGDVYDIHALTADSANYAASAGTAGNATKWNNHTFDEITNLVHGVVDTYVIPAQTTNKTTDYKAIVESESAQVTTTLSKLKGLVSNAENGFTYNWDKIGVGDIILMGATSDGKINFDRWVSYVGTETDPTIKLDVLETQVATHHHTITTTPTSVVKSISLTSTTTAMATTGASTTVVTGKTSSDVTSGYDFITSIEHTGGDYNFEVVAASASTADSVGHSHTVSSHNHSVTLGHAALVSTRVSAYTSLTSTNKTLHTHGTNVTAAGSKTDDSSPTKIVTGGTQTTVVATLTESSATTGKNTTGLATGDNTTGLSTNDIDSTTTTASSGSHTHSVSAKTSESFVKTVDIAPSVVTSVSWSVTAPSVAPTVVTAVGRTITSADTVVDWSASVDTSGILSFTVTPGKRLTGVTITSTTVSQTPGSTTISASSTAQSHTSSIVTATCTTGSAGSHSHGFSHTHTIPAHSHSIASHTHEYNKTVQSSTASAYTSLTSTNKTLHTHGTNVTAAGSKTDDSSPTKIVTGGTQTSVVEALITNKAFTTTSSNPTTDTVYHQVDIIYPGLSIKGRKFTTDTVTEASATTIKPYVSFTSSSATVVESVTEKTSTNKGGN